MRRRNPSAKVKLRKNGTSIVATIPKKFLDFLRWKLGTEIEIELVWNPESLDETYLIIKTVERRMSRDG